MTLTKPMRIASFTDFSRIHGIVSIGWCFGSNRDAYIIQP